MVKCIIHLALGLWLIISGFVPELLLTGNMMITGGLLVVLSWNYKNWLCIACGVLGLWGFVSGLFLEMASSLNFILVGIVVTLLSLWGAKSYFGEKAHKIA